MQPRLPLRRSEAGPGRSTALVAEGGAEGRLKSAVQLGHGLSGWRRDSQEQSLGRTLASTSSRERACQGKTRSPTHGTEAVSRSAAGFPGAVRAALGCTRLEPYATLRSRVQSAATKSMYATNARREKLITSKVKPLTSGTQLSNAKGSSNPATSSSGTSSQRRQPVRQVNSAKPRHPRAAMPEAIGSRATGSTTQRRIQKPPRKMRATVVGFTAVRSFSVSHEARRKAG